VNQILLITTIATLGPLVGSLLGVFQRCSEKILYNFLGFAAGIMLAISFINLIPESLKVTTLVMVVFGVIFGAIIIFLVKKAIPHIPTSRHFHEDSLQKIENTATLIIVGIFIHNFPEGLAIGIGFLQSFHLSLAIALGLAIHDIPEAVCTSLPYYSLNGKRLKSFLVSASTVIPTLLGILIAYFFLGAVSSALIGFLMASTAGVMIYIAADELIPVSFSKLRFGSIYSLACGLATVVLLTLI